MSVWIPVLVWSVLTVEVVLVTTLSPDHHVSDDDCVVPDHCVCQAFHTVPIASLFDSKNVSKLPSTLTIKSGAISVSNQSSLNGSRTILPAQLEMRTGVTRSTLVAYGCSSWTTSVYGRVIRSPVFW